MDVTPLAKLDTAFENGLRVALPQRIVRIAKEQRLYGDSSLFKALLEGGKQSFSKCGLKVGDRHRNRSDRTAGLQQEIEGICVFLGTGSAFP